MLKTLQKRFTWIAMLSFTLVMLLILGFINTYTYVEVMEGADARVEMLLRRSDAGDRPENGEDEWNEEEPLKRDGKPRRYFFGGNFLSEESPNDSRFFTVTFNAAGTITAINTGRIASVDSETAEAMAKEIHEDGKTYGLTDHYRFGSHYEGEHIIYCFLDCSRELSTFNSFLTTSALAAVAGLLIAFILIIVFSSKAMAPVAESYEKQKRFITDASHEIKTPLAVINAANEVTELEAGETEWTKSISKQIDRLTSLTEKLVMLSRMDEESYRPDTVRFNLSDALKETAESFAPVALQKNKTYTVHIDDGISYEGDENALRQLASLLIDNAMKYSDENGSVTVSLKKSGRNSIEFRVENSVEEIKKGNQDILFERFYRADASRNSATGGHGIGLSVAKAIVTAHKGKISAWAPDEKHIVFTAIL